MDTNLSCERNCLGCTQIKDGIVRWIKILLKKPGTDVFYSKEALIAALLHEFAHCITPPSIEDHHSKLFYSNFEKILRVAELKEIFILPTKANKFSYQSLRRFDAIDLGVAPASSCGYSPLYNPFKTNSNSLRIVVIAPNHEQKLITLSHNEKTLTSLSKLIKQKFQLKPKAIILPGGEKLTNEILQTLLIEPTLHFS
ncbi:unnamed protein product [Rotaria magnacalcarata]|uniref:Uncharacterized protein n=1 Tax=Rotaria magnacalcarata TaxID=392030 RepID=A0A816LD77_9BILA|nr:unnamed protein product [Rotaria magnacalcarata]